MGLTRRGAAKPKQRADSSAGRKNDVADKALVRRIVSSWDAANAADLAAEKLSRHGVSKAIRDGFKLRDATPATWAALVADPFWDDHPKQRPKVGDQEDAVKYVLAIHFGEANRASKRVSDYRLAVAKLQEEGCGDEDVIKAIRSGPKIADILARRRQPGRSGSNGAQGASEPDKAVKPKSVSPSSSRKPTTMTLVLEVEAKKLSALTSAKLPAKVRLELDLDCFKEGQAAGTARKLKILDGTSKPEKTSTKP